MTKMVSLKKTAAERRAEKDALGETSVFATPGEDEGVTVHLDHHQLMHMGVGGDMKSGHDVEFHPRIIFPSQSLRQQAKALSHIRAEHGGFTHGGRFGLLRYRLDYGEPAPVGGDHARLAIRVRLQQDAVEDIPRLIRARKQHCREEFFS